MKIFIFSCFLLTTSYIYPIAIHHYDERDVALVPSKSSITKLSEGFVGDRRSNVQFAAPPSSLYLIAPNGVIITFIDFGHLVSNCTWGDDQSTLFLTAEYAVYSMKLKKENKNV